MEQLIAEFTSLTGEYATAAISIAGAAIALIVNNIRVKINAVLDKVESRTNG